MNKVAIVTSSIGRKTLTKTIDSVLKQSIDCRHYIFAHGKEYWYDIQSQVKGYKQIESVFLPNNCGKNGYGMAPVYALAPFVVEEDFMFYLDDDNWFEDNHCYACMEHIKKNNLDWCFSLRKIVNNDGNFICDDDCESLGYFENFYNSFLVDNSSYCVNTEVARKISYSWYYPRISDRMFLKSLLEGDFKGGCTGLASSIYRLSHDGSNSMTPSAFLRGNSIMFEKYKGNYPWRQPSIYGKN